MKSSRFRQSYRKNASKLHKKVGDTIRTINWLCDYIIYQEYPVNRVNTDYPHSSHHFDWVIPRAKLVIECHGRQHYDIVAFDGVIDGSIENFKELKARDAKKKEAAQQAGFIYVEIPYNHKDTIENIIWNTVNSKIDYDQKGKLNAINTSPSMEMWKEKQREIKKETRHRFLSSEQHKKQLEYQRIYRKERYKQDKERREQNE